VQKAVIRVLLRDVGEAAIEDEIQLLMTSGEARNCVAVGLRAPGARKSACKTRANDSPTGQPYKLADNYKPHAQMLSAGFFRGRGRPGPPLVAVSDVPVLHAHVGFEPFAVERETAGVQGGFAGDGVAVCFHLPCDLPSHFLRRLALSIVQASHTLNLSRVVFARYGGEIDKSVCS